jgi:hypothetical protein
MAKAKGEFSSQDLWKIYRETFNGAFEIEAPRWNIKDWKNWCRLVDEIGIDKTNLLFNFVIENWARVKLKFKITGFPTVGILWCYRHSLLDYMNEKSATRNNIKKEGSVSSSSKRLFLSQ